MSDRRETVEDTSGAGRCRIRTKKTPGEAGAEGKRAGAAWPAAVRGEGRARPEACVAPPMGRRRGPRRALQVEAEADAGRVVAVAERAADRERRAFADLLRVAHRQGAFAVLPAGAHRHAAALAAAAGGVRSEEHTSELQSLMRISYAV